MFVFSRVSAVCKLRDAAGTTERAGRRSDAERRPLRHRIIAGRGVNGDPAMMVREVRCPRIALSEILDLLQRADLISD